MAIRSSDHIPSIAAAIPWGSNQETYLDMYFNEIDFDQAAENYVTNQMESIEEQLGPADAMSDADIETVSELYGMTESELADLGPDVTMRLPITDNPVEKAAYQIEQTDRAVLEFMRSGFTVDEAQARASAIVNNPSATNPWGQSLTLEEVQAVLQAYPGAGEIGNPNSEDATNLLMMTGKLDGEFDGTVDAALQAQEANSFMGSAWDFVKNAGSTVAGEVGQTLADYTSDSPIAAGAGALLDMTATPAYAATTDTEFPDDIDAYEQEGEPGDIKGFGQVWDTIKGVASDASDYVGDLFGKYVEPMIEDYGVEQFASRTGMAGGISSILGSGPGDYLGGRIQDAADMQIKQAQLNYLSKAVQDGTIFDELTEDNFTGPNKKFQMEIVEQFIDDLPPNAQGPIRSHLGDIKVSMQALSTPPVTSPETGMDVAQVAPTQPAMPDDYGFPTGQMGDPTIGPGGLRTVDAIAAESRRLLGEGYSQKHIDYLLSEGIDARTPEGASLMNVMKDDPSLTVEEALAEIASYQEADGDDIPIPNRQALWADNMEEWNVRYGNIFGNIYSQQPDTSELSVRDRERLEPYLFGDAEIGYYLERPLSTREWRPREDDLVREQKGEFADKEETHFSDYLQDDFFGSGAGGFYDRLDDNAVDLRNRMMKYNNMGMDEMWNMWDRGKNPQLLSEEWKRADFNIQDDIQDRLTFMDPSTQPSRNRLTALAALYNTPRGSGAEYRSKMQTFFDNTYNSWTKSGRTPEDFLRVFIQDKPKPQQGLN